MRLILIKMASTAALIPAAAVGEPDALGQVELAEPIEFEGKQFDSVPAETCLSFNEDLMLHYNGLINGTKGALRAADQMMKAYGQQAFEIAPLTGRTH